MIQGKHAAEVIEYAESIVAGGKVACKELIQACQRFLNDIDSGEWDIRTGDADWVIEIIQRLYKHRQGQSLDGMPLRGTPFMLASWQKFAIYAILIFYVPGTIERRVKEAFIFVPRKNGKTILMSALAWALGMLERRSGSTVYVVGAVLKEAMKTYENWEYNMTRIMYQGKRAAQEDGWRILDNNMEHSISNQDLDGGSMHLEALAGNPDSQDSFNANIIIADEVHAYKTPKQYNILKEATKAYTNKLVIAITTAGDNTVSFCYRRLQYCKKVLDGVVKDDAYFIFICKADEDENGEVSFTDQVQHEKANPNYGVTIRPADIMNDALQAQNDPQQRKDFYAKSLNIYTSAIKAYFNIEDFKKSNRKAEEALGIDPAWTVREKIEFLAGLKVNWYGGADMSKLHDLTAAALHGEYKGIDIVIPHCWFPVVAAFAKAEEDGIPLFGWKDDGWLSMSNSPTVNHAEVVAWFISMRKMGFNIKKVGHDRKFCREYFYGMKRSKFKIVDQPQYFYKKSEGFRHIENRVLNGKYYYLGSDAYEYCVMNVAAIEKTDDMIQYEKTEPEHRIDVFDADVFATVRMLEEMGKIHNLEEWFDGEEE